MTDISAKSAASRKGSDISSDWIKKSASVAPVSPAI
jgi:hypothetical protein